MNLRPLFQLSTPLAEAIDAGAAVLTPNRRLSRAVRAADQQRRMAQGKAAWVNPSIMPLRQYWQDRWQQAVTRGLISPQPLLDASAQRLLWRQIIENDDQAGFSLLSPGQAALLCQEAFELLGLWRLDLRASALRQEFDFHEDTRRFVAWAETFQEVLREKGFATAERAQEALLDFERSPDHAVVLLETDQLSPLYKALTATAATSQRLAASESPGVVASALAFADGESELAAAASWCREMRDRDPVGRYGVVLSDMHYDRDRFETCLRREFNCLTENYESLPVNFATGFALRRVPIVRDALNVLAISSRDVDVEQAIAVLQSPFLRLPAMDVARCEGQTRRLRELGHQAIPQALFRELVDPLVDSDIPAPWRELLRIEAEHGLRRHKKSPSAWRRLIPLILENWGWPWGRALDSLEYQQLQTWKEALDRFSTLDSVVSPLDYEAALGLLEDCLQEEQFQPETADQAIQVLGPLETTGLSFDGLWVTGMNAERWPASARPNPYLPFSVQRRLRMPHCDAAWEWEWTQQRWLAWRQGSRQLQASYIHHDDGRTVLASPLLNTHEVTVVADTTRADPRWTEQRLVHHLETIARPNSALIEDDVATLHRGSGLIEAQSLCPFQAFAAYRLGATPASVYFSGLSAAERGSVLHHALYLLANTYPNREALRDADEKARKVSVSNASSEALSTVHRHRRRLVGEACLELEQRRLEALLSKWLEGEALRESSWRIEAREADRALALGPLTLNLRLDRVDELDRGQRVVLDYKSGRIDPLSHWLEERPRKPQLPLYALAEPKADAVSYVSLRSAEISFRGLGASALLSGIEPIAQRRADELEGEAAMEAQRADWRRELEALAEEFVSGEAAVTPSTDACRYCAREALCRRDDLEP